MFKKVSRVFQEVLRGFQGVFRKTKSLILNGCSKGISGKFQRCFKGVSRKFQGWSNKVLVCVKGSFKGVS